MVWKGDSSGRLAKSLITLIDQVDAKWPNRSRVSDGSIGDRAHQARASDHNPGEDGVVEALDITHDPEHGVDTWKLADTFRLNRDSRIDYVISNGRIFAGPDGPQPWIWRPYTGQNNHAQHIHVSVRPNASIYDNTAPWALTYGGQITPTPSLPMPKGIDANIRRRMMMTIMGYEGKIPPGISIAPDGRPEIAGITQKDHPQQFDKLKILLDRGAIDELQEAVIQYYLQYTMPAQNWTDRAGLEFFLRDCILNRGPTGAAEILQMAVKVEIDHQIGPETRGALAALDPDRAIDRLRSAREQYEDKKYPNRRKSGQWQGMLNRWNKAQTQAKAFQKEQGYTPVKSPEGAGAGGVIIVGTGTVIAAKQSAWSWTDVGMALFVIGVAAVVAFLVIRAIRRQS